MTGGQELIEELRTERDRLRTALEEAEKRIAQNSELAGAGFRKLGAERDALREALRPFADLLERGYDEQGFMRRYCDAARAALAPREPQPPAPRHEKNGRDCLCPNDEYHDRVYGTAVFEPKWPYTEASVVPQPPAPQPAAEGPIKPNEDLVLRVATAIGAVDTYGADAQWDSSIYREMAREAIRALNAQPAAGGGGEELLLLHYLETSVRQRWRRSVKVTLSELDALRARAAGPVEVTDTQRLDWLEKHDASIGYVDLSDEPSHWIVSEDLENETPIAMGFSLREAIDDAMRGERDGD